MSAHLFANLAPDGWVEIPSDAVVSMNSQTDPVTWIKEGGQLDSIKSVSLPDNLDSYPFVHIAYNGREYRVSPLHLQVVDF